MANCARRFAATGVSIDTRTLLPGDLFVALCAETGDGHDHVPDALAKAAAGCMVHWEMTGRALIVDDTLAGLARIGGYARARFTGRLAAITGSVGKTTTKEMLRTILAAQAPTHAAVASYNNQWGLPLTLARMPPDATFCVAEIGMNHAGEIEPLARLARPHLALITTIEKAHIGHLGSIEAIADEKAAPATRPGARWHRRAAGRFTPSAASARCRRAHPDHHLRHRPAGRRPAGFRRNRRRRHRCCRRSGRRGRSLPSRRTRPAHGDERAGGADGRRGTRHRSPLRPLPR